MHLKGVFRLTAIAAALRALGTFSDLYLLRKLGAVGVGRTSMLMGVCGFFAVVASSGVSLGMTRLTAEALATKGKNELPLIRRAGLSYATLFGMIAAVILYSISPYLATFFDTPPSPVVNEAENALKIWALGMLFCAVSSALAGYLIGINQAVTASVCTAGGQTVRVLLLILQLSKLPFWTYGGMIRIAVASISGELAATLALAVTVQHTHKCRLRRQ